MGKYEALANFLDVEDLDDIESLDEKEFDTPCGRFMVLTDFEADELADQNLESQIEELVLTKIPENLRLYFNKKSLKSDVLDSDGRASVICSYDGIEHEERDTDGESYYIYRLG